MTSAQGDGGTSSLFGLAPCGVCPARRITAAAVRSYRTFSPLPRRSGQSSPRWHDSVCAQPKTPSFRNPAFSPAGRGIWRGPFQRPSHYHARRSLTRTAGRYIFCGTFRRASSRSMKRGLDGRVNSPSRTLSGTLLCGVRTFLPAHSRKSRKFRAPARMGGATVRPSCQHLYYMRCRKKERPFVVRPSWFAFGRWLLAPQRFAFALNRLDPAPPAPPFLAKSLNLKGQAGSAPENWPQRT